MGSCVKWVIARNGETGLKLEFIPLSVANVPNVLFFSVCLFFRTRYAGIKADCEWCALRGALCSHIWTELPVYTVQVVSPCCAVPSSFSTHYVWGGKRRGWTFSLFVERQWKWKTVRFKIVPFLLEHQLWNIRWCHVHFNAHRSTWSWVKKGNFLDERTDRRELCLCPRLKNVLFCVLGFANLTGNILLGYIWEIVWQENNKLITQNRFSLENCFAIWLLQETFRQNMSQTRIVRLRALVLFFPCNCRNSYCDIQEPPGLCKLFSLIHCLHARQTCWLYLPSSEWQKQTVHELLW